MRALPVPDIHSRQEGVGLRILIIIILGAVFTAWCVDASFEKGRLSSIPNYDDVGYFLSGTRLLESMKHSNPPVLDQLVYKNFHAPLSTIMAATAFAVIGYHDYAPYIFNLSVILLYLFLLGYILRKLSLVMLIPWLVCFLCLPFATMAVVEFRPDLCWALLVGFSAIYAISSPGYFDERRSPVIHSILFALSLLVKPSMFAMTIIIFGVSAGFRAVIQRLDTGHFPWGIIAKTGVGQGTATCMITGPYVFLFGGKTWNYFWANLFGINKTIWSYNGNWQQQFSYYLFGPSMANNLGNIWWLICGCWLLGSIAVIAGRNRKRIQFAAGLWGLGVVTYFLSSLARMKSPFLGGAFYSIAILGAACFVAELIEETVAAGGRLSYAKINIAGIVLAALCILMYQWPPYSGAMNSKTGRNYKNVGEKVENEIAGLSLPENPLIVFTHTGPVRMGNVAMWFLRQGQTVRVRNLSFARTPEDFKKSLKSAALVFLQDKSMTGANLLAPSESLQPQFKSIIGGNPQFNLLKKIETMDGKYIYLYINQRFQ